MWRPIWSITSTSLTSNKLVGEESESISCTNGLGHVMKEETSCDSNKLSRRDGDGESTRWQNQVATIKFTKRHNIGIGLHMVCGINVSVPTVTFSKSNAINPPKFKAQSFWFLLWYADTH
jgi:hypothetical protein